MIYAVVHLNYFFLGGVGRAAAGQPRAEELRGQDQGEPGDDRRLPHPRRHAWLLYLEMLLASDRSKLVGAKAGLPKKPSMPTRMR